MRTLDETKVSSFQGVVGGKTLVVFFTACVRNAWSCLRRAWPSASFSMGGGRGTHARAPVCNNRMGSVSGDYVGSICGDRMGRFCGDRMGSVCGDRMGRFCGNRTGSISGDRMGSVSGDRVGRLICYTETRSTR